MGKKVLQKEFTKEQKEVIQAKVANDQSQYKSLSAKKYGLPVYMIFRDLVDNPKLFNRGAAGKIIDIARSIADIKKDPEFAKLAQFYDESDPSNLKLRIPILKKGELTVRFKEVVENEDVSIGIDRIAMLSDIIPGSFILISGVYCSEQEKVADGKQVINVYMNAAKFSLSRIRDEVYDKLTTMMIDSSLDENGKVIQKPLADDVMAPLSNDSLARSIYYAMLQAKLDAMDDAFVFRNLEQKKQVSILVPSENNQYGVKRQDGSQVTYGGALTLLNTGSLIAKGVYGYQSCKFSQFTFDAPLPGENKMDLPNAIKTIKKYTSGVFFTEETEFHVVEEREEKLNATSNFVFAEQPSKAEIGKDGGPKMSSINSSADLCGVTYPLYFKGMMQTHHLDIVPSFCLNQKKTTNIPDTNPDGTLTKWDLKVTNVNVVANLPAYLERCLQVIDHKFMINIGQNLLDVMDYLTRDMTRIVDEKENAAREQMFNPDIACKPTGMVRKNRKDVFKTDAGEEKNRNFYNNLNSPGSNYKNLDEMTLDFTHVLKENLECGFLPCYIGYMDKFEESWKAPIFTAPRNGKASPSVGEIFNRCVQGTWSSEKEAAAWFKISWLAVVTSWVSFNPMGKYSTYVDAKSAEFKENAWEKMIEIAKEGGIEFNWTIINLTKNLANFVCVPFTRPKISRVVVGKVEEVKKIEEVKMTVEKKEDKRKRDDEPIPKIELEFSEDDQMPTVAPTELPKSKKTKK